MAEKEKRGGVLTNKEVEEDLKVKSGGDVSNRAHAGSQDTGDNKVRGLDDGPGDEQKTSDRKERGGEAF